VIWAVRVQAKAVDGTQQSELHRNCPCLLAGKPLLQVIVAVPIPLVAMEAVPVVLAVATSRAVLAAPEALVLAADDRVRVAPRALLGDGGNRGLL
jgi:hypothetical protein